MNLEFEWDEAKAEENYAKHGVSFDAAKGAFKDPSPPSSSTTGKTTAKNAS